MSFSAMPVIIAAAVTTNTLNTGRGGALPPDNFDRNLERGLMIMLCSLLAILGFFIAMRACATETSTVVNAKVVQAWVEGSKKSNGYQKTVHMKLDVDGYQWEPSETVRFSVCPEVMYNTSKPIYIKTYTDWFSSYRWASGIVAFCKK